MSNARDIRTKIGSVKNTQKITRAMELVAESKMKKAQEYALTPRAYAEKIRQVISHVANAHTEYKHPYLTQRENIKRVGFIVVSTDRGLCGSLNINLFKKIIEEMKWWHEKSVEIDLCIIGHKAEVFFKRFGATIKAHTSHLGDKPNITDIIGIVKVMLDEYNEEKLDRLYIFYNKFINTITQKPQIEPLLPLEVAKEEVEKGYWDYIYEPDAKDLLTTLLVRYIETQVYQATIENSASQQAATMIAMKNATDNAGELIGELKLIYKKARQAAITQEISEIIGGAAAV